MAERKLELSFQMENILFSEDSQQIHHIQLLQ